MLSHVKIRQEDEVDAIERKREEEKARARMNFQHQNVSAMSGAEGESGRQAAGEFGSQQGDQSKPFVRDVPKVGRNDPCPCGSGKKYKVCHGKLG